jgi:uncharacterized protein
MSAFVIDAFEFCRVGGHRQGETAVADLPRLAKESVDGVGTIRWSLQGGRNGFGHLQLTLSVSGTMRLICQRCLTPFDFDIASDSVLVLAKDEAKADEIEVLLMDQAVEVIVGSNALNIADLIEDEVLLAIPLSPRHETCPDGLAPEVEKDAEKVSPFAVLKKLKQ